MSAQPMTMMEAASLLVLQKCETDTCTERLHELIDAATESLMCEKDLLGSLCVLRDVGLLKCKLEGRTKNFKLVVDHANKVLDCVQRLKDILVHTTNQKSQMTRTNLTKEASALSYKGFSMLKLYQQADAILLLEQAQQQFKGLGIQNRQARVVQQILLEHHQHSLQEESQSPPQLVKFPRTTHLIDMGASTSDDLVSDTAAISKICKGTANVFIEEKVDGANLGISCSGGKLWAQNRSRYISSGEHAQFSRLEEWLAEHEDGLKRILQSSDCILYGEWMVARHSIPYHKLPGYFVAFDIYDKTAERFLSRARFHGIMRGSLIPVVPTIGKKSLGPYPPQHTEARFRADAIRLLESRSAFRSDGGPVEGVVLRVDGDDWLQERFKIVRSDFIAGCSDGHWSKRTVEKQRLDFEFAQTYLETCYQSLNEEQTTEEAAEDFEKKPAATKGELAQRNRARRRIPRCVMCMGLPGSGKSTFAQYLKNSGGDWIHVNQDEMGRKEATKQASRASRQKRVIVDRCHPTEADRREWWQVMHSPNKADVALVYFAADASECTERVLNRLNHPGIPAGRGTGIVKRVSEMLEPPTANEKLNVFGVVETVSSFEDSRRLLRKWGVCVI